MNLKWGERGVRVRGVSRTLRLPMSLADWVDDIAQRSGRTWGETVEAILQGVREGEEEGKADRFLARVARATTISFPPKEEEEKGV